MPWQAWLMLKSTVGKIKKSKILYTSVEIGNTYAWGFLFEHVLFIHILIDMLTNTGLNR